MRRIPVVITVVLLSACAETPSLGVSDMFSSYRVDVRQGNFITQEMVSQLKPGQSREQVRFILGTPLVTDPFHDNRWDYVYRYDDGNGNIQQRRFSVFFEANQLTRVAGDVAPADGKTDQVTATPKPREIEIAPAAGANTPKAGKPPVPETDTPGNNGQ